MKKKVIITAVCLILGISPWLGAGEKSGRDFGFGNMEIFQFKNDTSYLFIEDMNRDRLADLLFLNNRASRLEVLIRLPSASPPQDLPQLSERFADKGFVLDQWTKTFQVADVNGDGLPDIVSMGDSLGLVIHIQQRDGSFVESASRYIQDAANLVNLTAADLNGDTYQDLLICRQENAEILWNNGKGEFKTNTPLVFSSGGCQGAIAADINGDSRSDLLFYFGSSGSLRVRLGIGSGNFDWEQTLLLPPVLSLKNVALNGDAGAQLAVLLKNGLILRLYGFQPRSQGHLLERVTVSTHRLPLLGVGQKEAPTWLTADFNRDGYSDFCVAAPLLSQVHLYMGGPAGLQSLPQRIDSLSAIKTIKCTPKGDLVVFSAAEKAIALHPAGHLTGFPQFFKAPGKPLAMAVGPPATVFGIFKDNGYRLYLFDADKPGSSPIQTHELTMANAPQDITLIPLTGQDHWLMILFMAYEPPLVFRLQGDKLMPLQPDQFRAMSLNLEAKSVSAVGSAQQPRLLISEGQVARLYQWQDGKFQVKRQINPGRKSARLTAACTFPDQAKKPGYLVYDEAGQDLLWFPAEGIQPPHPIHFSEELKDLTGLAPLDFKGRSGLVLVGNSEIQWLQDQEETLNLKTLGEYTSQAENPSLWSIFPVTLGSPGRKMLALLDSNNRSVELVSKHGQELKEELVFEIFQDPGFREAAPGYEPHAVGTGDFNGDNIYDMAVLVHDKLILYLGE
jgi:hypothetical protein